jgi:RNA polymerase sigma-70 factor (family 1)
MLKLIGYTSDSTTPPDDSTLFKQLFKEHASGIYRLAYAQLHARVEAQDIVQECFLKFWEKRQEVSADPKAIKGYLYTSAYHAILNQLQRQRTWAYQDYTDDLMLEHEPQLMQLEYEELTQHYSHALAQLPTKRREIFTMSRQLGLSNATIAQELNISIKTVEAQITQALKFLRAYFQAYGVTLILVLLLQA